jgi:hypothetical protein
MNLGELAHIQKVAALMKEMGITRLKVGDMELHRPIPEKAAPGPTEMPEDIEDKVEEFKSLMKLDDQSIMERMFPEPREPGGSDDPAAPN